MILNGVEITTLTQLEIEIATLPETTKNSLRASFLGESTWVELTQKEKDFNKYLKRAAAKNIIMAEMASENMERVRNGVWTVPQLVELTQDAELKLILNDIETLSFELAYQKLLAATNPMITSEIKTQWATKLVNNFFNGG
jgi:hypothetical protein